MSIFNRVGVQERTNFANNLAVMLKSGISIDEALTALAEQANSKYFQKTIIRVRTSIENGVLLSKSFEKESRVFGPIFTNLVKVGEESGTLQDNLQFLADWFERSSDLQRDVAAATLYPKLVFGAALLLGGGLALFILPKLIPLFSQLNVELPVITRVLLWISLFLQENWLLCIIGGVFLYICFHLLSKLRLVRYFLHTLYIHVPFFGSLVRNYQLALITQLFGTLIHSGVPITTTTEIIANAVPNVRYQESIKAMQESIHQGNAMSGAMAKYPFLYPKMIVSIVSVGEKSGTLSDSFSYLSEYYSKEVKSQTKKIPTVVEPLLLIFIAAIVGFVALAIIMPIYEITGSVGR